MLKGFKPEKLRVGHESKPLTKHKTSMPSFYKSSDEYELLLKEATEEMGEMQEMLYSQDERSLLIVVQGMDTSGKDSLIKHVFSGMNPQGCEVTSFKRPSSLELDHDFLWRTHRRVPARGMIGIFNRSYYEDVIVVRVHPELLSGGKVPAELRKLPALWKERYKDIVNQELYLSRQGVRILKFFLHISKDEQRKRLVARIDDPKKHWKFEPADYRERQFWSAYQKAYSECLKETSTREAPWYVIPADDKKNARLMVSHIIVETLKSMKLKHPKVSADVEKELQRIRAALVKEA